MKQISLEQLLQLHVLALQSFGGSEGLRDLGRLEAALATQTQEVFGEELYPNVYQKAAALCRGIIGDHPFADGNKRTAMLTALTYVEINGLVFEAEPGELEDFAVQIAVEHLDVAAIAEWLQAHTKAV
jgi:death-on-curing protein